MLRGKAVLAAALLPLAIVFAGCAPVHVSSHLERGADFSRYHSFAWAPADNLPTGDPRLDNNPFFHDYLQGAVERHLRDHGITLASNPDNADLLIHYHAAVSQRFDVASSNRTTTGGYVEPQVIDYDESTIVLDLVDAQSKRLVWRGWAQESLQGIINNQERMEKHIDASVVRMLQRLPL